MKKEIFVSGMHCVSCEMLLESSLSGIKGVKVVSINHKTGKLTVEYKNKKDLVNIKQKIADNGFKISVDSKNNNVVVNREKNSLHDYIAIAYIFILFISFYWVFKLLNLDINSLIPSVGGNVTFLMAILFGVAASLSTCLALVGGIVMSLDNNNKSTKINTHLYFHLGRIIGFFVLGGILGLIGNIFSISLTVSGVLSIAVGMVIFYVGLQILKIVPNITSLGFSLPKELSKSINSEKAPFVIGVLTFFLPCGFTQSMQLVAISSGSFLTGALTMMFFALGTTPILLLVGKGTAYIKDKKFNILNKIIGVVIVIFGFFSVTNGYNLIGGINAFSAPSIEKSDSVIDSGEKKELKVSHNGWQLEPYEIKIDSNKAYKLSINPTKNGIGCMSVIAVPGIDNNFQRIISGKEIIFNLPKLKKGKYSLTCGMGMIHGYLVVK